MSKILTDAFHYSYANDLLQWKWEEKGTGIECQRNEWFILCTDVDSGDGDGEKKKEQEKWHTAESVWW